MNTPSNKRNVCDYLLTHSFLYPREILHQVAKCLYLIEAYGLRVRQTETEIWYSNLDLYEAKKIMGNFGESRVKISVSIGSSMPQRSYPIEKYLIAFRKIIDKGASIVILGGASEADDAKFLEDNLPTEFVKNVVKLKPSWRTTSAIMSLTDIYIGNDTGIQHVAAALKKPIIAISCIAKDKKQLYPDFPTELDWFNPWQIHAIILQPEHQIGKCNKEFYYRGCIEKKSHCIAQIDPQEIVDAYDKMLSFIRDIRQVKCPSVIKTIDQITPLKL